MKKNYVYMLRCQNGALYTGWTNDLKKRVAAHNLRKGAKYTRAFGPCQLVYFESFETRTEALKREAAIKKMAKNEKEALIQSFQANFNECLKEKSKNESEI